MVSVLPEDIESSENDKPHTNRKPVLVSSRQAAGHSSTEKNERRGNLNSHRIEKLEALLFYESEVRRAKTIRELVFCIANETRKVVNGQQIFVMKSTKSQTNSLAIDAVSNLSSIDKNAPAVVTLQKEISLIGSQALARPTPDCTQPYRFKIPSPVESADTKSIMRGAFIPLMDERGRMFAAIIVLGEKSFSESDVIVLARVGETVRHAWLALKPKPTRFVSQKARKAIWCFLIFGAVLAMALPVPLSTLAPVEIVPKSPQIVAAPIDGVIEEMLVDANAVVNIGDPLFRFVDTALESNRVIALQKRGVATARLQSAQQNSFGSGEGARDLIIAQAELRLADAELAYADTQFSKSVVRAKSNGIAVFNNKSDWQGKPVSIGERVLEIASPESTEALIDLAISDSISLKNGADVKLFLDSNPLSPIKGVVISAAYRAAMTEADTLAYNVVADIDLQQTTLPRIGARGTAQIFGEDVPLGFYLFRKPLSAVRQWVGW